MDTLEQELAETGDRLNGMESELLQRAERLSVARKKTAVDFEKAVSRELQHLSFAATLFKVDFSPFARKIEELTPTGWDRVEFLFSANPGEPLKPLVKTASGGELSRLLLGLKCILARRDQVGTVIFDEVDAGIGGQAAEDIARKIKELSGHHQVLCITHLPQIAAKADAHFMVEKKMQNNRTRTVISLLDEEGRIRELARMLAGNAVTKETIALVKGLYNEGATTETKT
jgi:DNA repair protein RecN (Recombination protein N)